MFFITQTGRWLLAVAVFAFGVEQLIFQHPLTAFIPMDATVKAQFTIAAITSILFFICSARIAFNVGGNYTAWLPVALFFVLFIAIHLPALLRNIQNGSEWTVCFELIALMSGALLAVTAPYKRGLRKRSINPWSKFAPFLFAAALLVFSILHFIYASFIATLVPAWLPFHLFWAYFFCVAFLAASVCIFLRKMVSFSMVLLAGVFFIWVMVLHLPRCFRNPQSESEWTSLFVALAMGATSLLVLSSAGKRSL